MVITTISVNSTCMFE
ncbi:MAG: hypothetical protein EOM28_05400 [Clostridia bacterium]|nr:hypothetical protein [Clostridia bacterium]